MSTNGWLTTNTSSLPSPKRTISTSLRPFSSSWMDVLLAMWTTPRLWMFHCSHVHLTWPSVSIGPLQPLRSHHVAWHWISNHAIPPAAVTADLWCALARHTQVSLMTWGKYWCMQSPLMLVRGEGGKFLANQTVSNECVFVLILFKYKQIHHA